MQSSGRSPAAKKSAATNARTFRTFLLMEQFAAREIGARIRQARKERGLTQEQLAEMASFSKRSLQDYEAGATIPYPHFTELSALLKKPTAWFLYGEEPDAPDVTDRLERIEERLAEVLARLEDEQADPAAG